MSEFSEEIDQQEHDILLQFSCNNCPKADRILKIGEVCLGAEVVVQSGECGINAIKTCGANNSLQREEYRI
jgi:hypothetical protein